MTNETKLFLTSVFDKIYNSVGYPLPVEFFPIEDYWKNDLREICIQYVESKSKNFNPERGEEKSYFGTIFISYLIIEKSGLIKDELKRENLKKKYKHIFRDHKLEKLLNVNK